MKVILINENSHTDKYDVTFDFNKEEKLNIDSMKLDEDDYLRVSHLTFLQLKRHIFLAIREKKDCVCLFDFKYLRKLVDFIVEYTNNIYVLDDTFSYHDERIKYL